MSATDARKPEYNAIKRAYEDQRMTMTWLEDVFQCKFTSVPKKVKILIDTVEDLKRDLAKLNQIKIVVDE